MRPHRRRADVVVSGPCSDEVPVRLTGSVVVEVIRADRTSLLVGHFRPLMRPSGGPLRPAG